MTHRQLPANQRRHNCKPFVDRLGASHFWLNPVALLGAAALCQLRKSSRAGKTHPLDHCKNSGLNLINLLHCGCDKWSFRSLVHAGHIT